MSDAIFRILVVAPLRAGADHVEAQPPWTEPVRFDRATFDESMARVAQRLALDVRAPGEPTSQRVDLNLDAMRAFRPDVLLERVPVLRTLRESASLAPPPAVEMRPPESGGSLIDGMLDAMSGREVAIRSAPPLDRFLGAILEHPVVRALERTWRGLHFLASHAAEGVRVDAIAAEADEVDETLARVARATPSESPYDLIVVDHEIGSARRDLDRLENWAARAEGLGAPLVTNGRPDLVGMDDLTALGRSDRRLRTGDDPRASAVRAVAAREVTRWVGAALNGAVARPRHSGLVRRAFGVTLDEKDELFVGPCHLVGALCAKSVARTGWPCAIAGMAGGVRELPVRTLEDRDSSVSTPLEVLVTEHAAAEAAAAGLMVFASTPNTDVALLPHATMLYRGAAIAGGSPAAASLGLADQLFVARVARSVVAVASAIPRSTPETAAKDVARIALAELFAGVEKARPPEISLAISGAPPRLEVTVRPRGFLDVRLEEVTLDAPLA